MGEKWGKARDYFEQEGHGPDKFLKIYSMVNMVNEKQKILIAWKPP